MSLGDLLSFFAGDAEAIRRLAGNPWVLPVGALLVLSAGLARHHDTHDLRRQWWRLLIPFAASTLAAAVLFLILALATKGEVGVTLGIGLLGLFWLTAPCAWLYGLPFERLWTPRQARLARRLALGAVATCRVALMARCVAVLLGYDWQASLLLMAGFALPTALVAAAVARQWSRGPEASFTPRPAPGGGEVAGAARDLMDFMGGVPASFPDHDPVQRPSGVVRLEPRNEPPVGVLLGGLAIALFALAACALPGLAGAPRLPPPVVVASPPDWSLWAFAGLAVLFWAPWLVLHQPAQRRRTVFVSRLRYGALAEAVRDLARLLPGDLPPHWDPATVLAREGLEPRLLEAAQVSATLPEGNWVRACFLERLGQVLPVWLDPLALWLEQNDRMPEAQLRDVAALDRLLRSVPEGPRLLHPYHNYLAELCAHTAERDPPRSEIVQSLLALALKRRPGKEA
jgi:hypothetical protein